MSARLVLGLAALLCFAGSVADSATRSGAPGPSVPGPDTPTVSATSAGSSIVLAPANDEARDLPVTPDMFGALCDSDGVTGHGHDDTGPIQAAIDYAERSGRPLKLPSTTTMCRTTAALLVTTRITITGDYCQPYTDLSASHPTPGSGSWLFFDHRGAGIQTAGPNAPSGGVYRDFCTIRPQPSFVAAGAWAPAAMDYDFSIAGDDTLFEHLVILNPTRGIWVQGRYTIRDLKGNPYLIGISSFHSEDLSRIEDVHFWPFDAINASAATFQHHNLEALQLYRVDNPMISNFFAIGARRCVHFMSNQFGWTSKAKFSNLECDLFGETGLLIDTDNVTAQIANFTAQGADPDRDASRTTAVNGIDITGRNIRVVLAGVRVTNVGADAVVATGSGTAVTLDGLAAERYGLNVGACAASANAGATVTVGPGAMVDNTGANGACLYGGSGTVNGAVVTKVN